MDRKHELWVTTVDHKGSPKQTFMLEVIGSTDEVDALAERIANFVGDTAGDWIKDIPGLLEKQPKEV